MLPIRQVVEWDIRRFCSYGWGDSIIQSLIERRHAIKLSHRCIDAVRTQTPCTPACEENCALKRYRDQIE